MKRLVAALLLAALTACAAQPIKVCADPNNLPFSNRAGQGFENRLADLIGQELKRPVEFVWWAQRRGFVRNTIGKHACDIWPGVAAGLESLATSRPYYRSSFVFVTREDDSLAGLTLDDPRLKRVSIGVQMVGDDGSNTPPAHALTRRGIVDNVRGYLLYGDYAQPDPPAKIVRAVADRQLDVGLVWGPLAGYFARQSKVSMRIEPVTPWLDANRWPMAFDISVGVAKDDPKLLKAINAALARRSADIGRLLAGYGVPRAG